MYDREILDLFKAMVVTRSGAQNVDWAPYGLVLDFVPSYSQATVLEEYFKPLDIKTLFTREQRDQGDTFELIQKQLLNYLETYVLNQPGLFDLEVSSGSIVKMTYVRGITASELGDMIRELLYRNAPIADVVTLGKIIKHYGVEYDVNKIANNEARVALFDPAKDTFENGDDTVRYICYLATGSCQIIKSKEMIQAVVAIAAMFPVTFLERHELQLAQVFNRHKRIIMALKANSVQNPFAKALGNGSRRSVINRISRLSKRAHVPLRESVNKVFVAKAIADDIDMSVLDKITLRDKLKYLNLLAYKRMQKTTDAFIVRNGKIHIEPNRKVWDHKDIDRVERAVLVSLGKDLEHLKDKRILLDPRVRYGLPTSRNQAVGQLPFGTRVNVGSDRISAGVYWENSWGATDLDLSTIDQNGERVGWGMYSGYAKDAKITFSGDVTYADHGAMEFMTSKDQDYGLFVNIFSGQNGANCEVVVGGDADGSKWISDVFIREKTKLASRGMVIGFVRGNEFTVWQGRIGNNRVSGNAEPYVARGMCEFWTVNDLFDHLDIKFDVDKAENTVYDYDVTYEGFSYDKLEGLLL